MPVTPTRTICSSALVCAVCASASAFSAEKDGPTRITRPEGYIQLEPDDGGPAPGAFSVAPAINTPDTPAPAEAEPEPLPVPPPKRQTPREVCQPVADRFVMRLTELRGGDDAGVLDPTLQKAMFGRVVLQALKGDPEEAVPEASWDAELKELRRTYLKCLKAERRR
jgi:hypothetical protein